MRTEHKTLKSGTLSTAELVFLVIATVSPLTVVYGFHTLSMHFGSGIGHGGIFLLVVPIWLLYAVGFTNMSRFIRNTGAFYAFNSQGLGRPIGIASSYMAWFAYTGFLTGNAGFVGYGMNSLIGAYLGIHIDWWIYSIICLLIIAVIGYRQVELGAKVLTILMAVEVILLLVLSAGAFMNPSPEGFTLAPFNPSVVFSGTFAVTIMFSFASFTGFEATTIFSEEVKNPMRAVPIATYWAVAILGVLYLIVSYSLVIGWGEVGLINKLSHGFESGNPTSMITDLAHRVFGGFGTIILESILVTSIFAAALTMHSLTSRYLFSSGRAGFLPKVFSKVHPKFGSPYVGSLFQTIIAILIISLTALAGWNPYDNVFAWLGGIAVIGCVTLYSITGISVIVYFLRTKVDTNIWRTKIAPGISSVGLIIATILIYVNFKLLFGDGNEMIAYILLILLLTVGVIGVIEGLWLKKNRPEVYKNIGISIDEVDSNTDSEQNFDHESQADKKIAP